MTNGQIRIYFLARILCHRGEYGDAASKPLLSDHKQKSKDQKTVDNFHIMLYFHEFFHVVSC